MELAEIGGRGGGPNDFTRSPFAREYDLADPSLSPTSITAFVTIFIAVIRKNNDAGDVLGE